MLLQFNFRNFKSFRDDVTLDMSATKITEHSNHIINYRFDKLLPVAAIYGANASGKSNVYQAFDYMTNYIMDSFKFGGDSDTKKPSEFEQMKPTPFLFDIASKDQDSMFEVYFCDPDDSSCKIYHYGFCLNGQGITEEWLNSKSKSARQYRRIFYRSEMDKELDLDGLSPKMRENIEIALEKEVLIVSLGAKLKIAKLKMIRDWFGRNMFTDFGNPFQDLFLSRMLPSNFVDNESVQSKVLEYFSSFDDSIKGFNIEKIKVSNEKDEESYRIDTWHKVIGTDETAAISLSSESAGTLKMFALFPHLQAVLERGSILFVDELNARLHPLLVRSLIQTFVNPELNPNHAQLIFTTHDTWQLSNDLLRRDEIWFSEKDSAGVSTLYSLADFVDQDGAKIRKDESYEKNYLLGKYGAIPSLKSFKILREGRHG